METYIRARTQEAILDAEVKVDRALKGAAYAMGCSVEIETVPGYMPLRNSPKLREVFKENAGDILGPEEQGLSAWGWLYRCGRSEPDHAGSPPGHDGCKGRNPRFRLGDCRR